MSNIPNDIKYSKSHEWVRADGEDEYTIGITDHAQTLLGDLVYIELPGVESELNSGEEVGVVESVKAASDVYTPISGEVIAVNEALADNPALVNEDPYGDGWLIKVRALDDNPTDELLDDAQYQELVTSEAH